MTDSSLTPCADDLHWMEHAFAQIGRLGRDEGLPIGAVIVFDGRVVGRGRNRAKATGYPTDHAEMEAIREATTTFHEMEAGLARKKAVKKLFKKSTLYTTMEPCPMCAGAVLMFRLERVVVAAPDPKWGALGSVGRLIGFPHDLDVEYSRHPDCEVLRSLGARQESSKAMLWELGRKYLERHGEGE